MLSWTLQDTQRKTLAGTHVTFQTFWPSRIIVHVVCSASRLPTESTFCCETSGKSKTTCTHGLYFIHSKQDNLYSWVVFYPFKARQLVLMGCIVPILGHCSQKKSKNLPGLAMKLLPLWLLLPQVQAWWCDTSERTGCRGQPRQFRKEIGQLDPIGRFQESLSRMGQVFSRQTIQTCFGT